MCGRSNTPARSAGRVISTSRPRSPSATAHPAVRHRPDVLDERRGRAYRFLRHGALSLRNRHRRSGMSPLEPASPSGSATLSVLMPNFDHARFLPESLGAILEQSYPPCEVIVIDDGSTDDSVEVLEKIAARHPL